MDKPALMEGSRLKLWGGQALPEGPVTEIDDLRTGYKGRGRTLEGDKEIREKESEQYVKREHPQQEIVIMIPFFEISVWGFFFFFPLVPTLSVCMIPSFARSTGISSSNWP